MLNLKECQPCLEARCIRYRDYVVFRTHSMLKEVIDRVERNDDREKQIECAATAVVQIHVAG